MTYTTVYDNARWWIVHDERLVGGYSANALRSYVFPLYTPSGVLVLQEAPPDHPHHQGVFTGLALEGYDLWNAGSFGLAAHRQELDRPAEDLRLNVTEHGVNWEHQTMWRTDEGVPLAREERAIRLSVSPDGTVLRWRSTWHPIDGPCHFGQTKEAGIGVRVPPHWESRFGGRIRNDRGAIGEAACFDQESRWINVEGAAGAEQVAGIVFFPALHSEYVPWFTRNYGLHVYNPTRHHPIVLEAGQSLTWEVFVVGYDGTRTPQEIDTLVAAVDR